MNKRQRKILNECLDYCNIMGAELDGTSTHERKYKDRQKAHRYVYRVLYAVLCDHPENDDKELDYSRAVEALSEMKKVT